MAAVHRTQEKLYRSVAGRISSMLFVASATAMALSVGPVHLHESYRDVTARLGAGTVTHRCDGRDDLRPSLCSRVLEYSSGKELITITFFRLDRTEGVSDILIERVVRPGNVRLRAAKKPRQAVRWCWEGRDVLYGPMPTPVPGWVSKNHGEFVKVGRSGVAAVFERSGSYRLFRLVFI